MRRALTAVMLLGAVLGVAASAHADTFDVTMTLDGTSGDSSVWMADLTGLGIDEICGITIIDDNDGMGGSPGIYSGMDVDAIYLDTNGAAPGGEVYASAYLLSAGSVRFTGTWYWWPSTTYGRPGILHGLDAANNLDNAIATLEALDADATAYVYESDGFLSLGDGGQLTAVFDPCFLVGETLHLVIAEAGGSEEFTVQVSTPERDPFIPEPSTGLLLLGAGAALLAARRSRKRMAS